MSAGRIFRRRYGASAWHLVALLLCFALSAYAVTRVFGNPAFFRIAVWFLGAAVIWDLVLSPAYALADKALSPLRRVAPRGIPLLNHVRAPLLVSSLLLLMWFPIISQRSERIYRSKTGLLEDPYLGRWLAVSGVLVVLSLAVWGLRVARSRPVSATVTD